ncbi:MAG: hypothetical protein J2P26_12295 [Nocardiopsaceae bacterium]|nr:hypothetical protein [Nocardiopsaceae bacterium]
MNDRAEQAGIDPVHRLTILAAALPGAVVRQRRIAAPFEAVWRVIADLEHSTPRYEPGVARVHLTHRHGQRLHLLVTHSDGREEPATATLRPGWCLMQSATAVVAFAANPIGHQTLLAHLEHRRGPAPAPGPSRSRQRRTALTRIDRELHVIEQLATRDKE